MAQTLYIGNLNYRTSESDLKDLFERNGIKVENINIIQDRYTGRSKGFAFIDVNDSDVEKAISTLNGYNFLERRIRIDRARPRSEPKRY